MTVKNTSEQPEWGTRVILYVAARSKTQAEERVDKLMEHALHHRRSKFYAKWEFDETDETIKIE